MELKGIGILLSCLAVLVFAIIKAMEEAARYVSKGTFDFMSWFIYFLIFFVFLLGIILIFKKK